MTTVYASPTLTIERDGPMAEMTLIRPDVMNRFDDALHVDMTDALRALHRERDLRAIVWSSTGKNFSAGGDFELMELAASSIPERLRIVDDGLQLLGAFLDINVPIVVALHGDAFGVGTNLVLASDAVVAHPGVRLGDPHVAIGLVAGDGGALLWPLNLGMLRAKRHVLTGDPVDGTDAHRLGLVTDLVEDAAAVLPAARSLAERIAALPPLAVQGSKQAMNHVLKTRFAEIMELSFALETTTLGSDDLLEAIAAFKERRPPTYTGT
jgi:enoyl-CoA hydratase